VFLPIAFTIQLNDTGMVNESVNSSHRHHVIREDGELSAMILDLEIVA
jgi:hypothetical protein